MRSILAWIPLLLLCQVGLATKSPIANAKREISRSAPKPEVQLRQATRAQVVRKLARSKIIGKRQSKPSNGVWPICSQPYRSAKQGGGPVYSVLLDYKPVVGPVQTPSTYFASDAADCLDTCQQLGTTSCNEADFDSNQDETVQRCSVYSNDLFKLVPSSGDVALNYDLRCQDLSSYMDVPTTDYSCCEVYTAK